MAWMSGWSRMASTASLSPLTTLRMPARQPRLDQQLRQHQRHAGVALGRLQDEGVAAGDGGRELPHRDHGGEVERRDARDDAERLAHGVEVDAGAGAFGVSPFSRCGMPIANSTTSRPRWMSPLASATVLPCSRASSRRACRCRGAASARNFISTRPAAAGWRLPKPAARPWRSRLPPATSALEASGTRAPASRPWAGTRRRTGPRALHVLAADEMRQLCRHGALPDPRPLAGSGVSYREGEAGQRWALETGVGFAETCAASSSPLVGKGGAPTAALKRSFSGNHLSGMNPNTPGLSASTTRRTARTRRAWLGQNAVGRVWQRAGA